MPVVEYERQGHIAIIRMNRPERLNALGYDLAMGLAEGWTRFRDDEGAWVGILTGVGRSFCAGMDVKERAESGRLELGRPQIPIKDPFQENEIDKPTIAAVNGYALGAGFFFASRCDLRVAAEEATFQVTEIVRGNIAGYDLMLWENLPYAVAAEMAVGMTLTARRAYEVGFVNRVVPREKVMETAMDLAQGLVSIPPLAVHHNLRLLRALRRERLSLPYLLRLDAHGVRQQLNTSEDIKESFKSFLEKRQPVYKRR